MMTLQPASLHRQADERLSGISYNPKKLVLWHTAVALGASLAIALMNYVCDLMIANTGGLSGMGMRSILSTLQAALTNGLNFAFPFWNIGLVYCTLGWEKGISATPKDLLQGFRRFGSVLGLQLITGGILLILGFALFQVSSMIFMLTPFSAPFVALLEPMLQNGGLQPDALPSQEALMAMGEAMLPLIILFSVLFCAVCVIVFYRLRFAKFALMEGMGAVGAVIHSFRITKKQSLKVFRLDLSFWWFYLLQILTVAISYGGLLLEVLGIILPISADASYLLFLALSNGCQCILLWQYQSHVSATYCLAYRVLSPHPSEAEEV